VLFRSQIRLLGGADSAGMSGRILSDFFFSAKILASKGWRRMRRNHWR
jgi:hypothetical protein